MSLEQGQVPTQQWQAPRSTPHLTAYDLLCQDTLGEYEILAELGRGGMATVYLSHDIALDRKVAIKVMSTESLDEGMAERFRREARTAASLNHPNIIPVYAVRERSGLLYFVMKFIPGQSLDPIIKGQGRVSIPMAHVILAQAAAALGYAHRRGVIHRDVKPANIMLDDEGWTVVTDFGIAKVATATGLTMTGVTVGTPAYMSPEQCAGREVTGASDQYSLGVVAYEMITGRKPFAATTAMAMMYAHFNETAAPLRELRPDCPPELEQRILRMLAKAPEDRFPTIEDIFGTPALGHDDPTRHEMVAFARSSPSASLVSRLSTPTSPIPPARRSVTPSAPGLLPRPGAIPTATGFQSNPPASASLSSSSPSSPAVPASRSSVWGLIGIAVALLVLVASFVFTRKPSSGALGNRQDSVGTSLTPIASDTTRSRDTNQAAGGPLPSTTPQIPPQPAAASTPVATVAAIQVTPPWIALETGGRQLLSAQVLSDGGAAMREHAAITWRSSAPRIATVARNGEVRAVAVGRAVMTGSVAGRSDSVVVEVSAPVVVPAPVASISVAPDSVSLAVGTSVSLAATPRDAAGAALPGREVSWSSNSRLATVSGSGQVQGVSPGVATVTATAQGRSAQVIVVVTPVLAASITLTGPTAVLKPGETAALATVVRGAQGEILADRRIVWESSDPAVASVAGGQVTARAAGTATITATVDRRSATARVTVAVPVDAAAERARALKEIDTQLDAVTAALTKRDIVQLRQSYPGMQADEERRWQALFTAKGLTRLQASFERSEVPKVEAATASQRVRMRLQVVMSGQVTENAPGDYLAKFEQVGGAWKLMQLLQQ